MDEDALRAVANHRDRQFAHLMVMTFGLAAQTDPDLFRNAIAQVFDLSAYEAQARRVAGLMAGIEAHLDYLRMAADDLARQLESLEYRMERAERPRTLRFNQAQ